MRSKVYAGFCRAQIQEQTAPFGPVRELIAKSQTSQITVGNYIAVGSVALAENWAGLSKKYCFTQDYFFKEQYTMVESLTDATEPVFVF